jgi:hypothetical protein
MPVVNPKPNPVRHAIVEAMKWVTPRSRQPRAASGVRHVQAMAKSFKRPFGNAEIRMLCFEIR